MIPSWAERPCIGNTWEYPFPLPSPPPPHPPTPGAHVSVRTVPFPCKPHGQSLLYSRGQCYLILSIFIDLGFPAAITRIGLALPALKPRDRTQLATARWTAWLSDILWNERLLVNNPAGYKCRFGRCYHTKTSAYHDQKCTITCTEWHTGPTDCSAILFTAGCAAWCKIDILTAIFQCPRSAEEYISIRKE